jgi:hypothetical protein
MPYFRPTDITRPEDPKDPFSVIVRGNSKGYFWGVIYNSYLGNDIFDVGGNKGINIKGLLAEDPYTGAVYTKDLGWIPLLSNDVIWLEYDVKNKKASIQSYGAGSKLDFSKKIIKNGIIEDNNTDGNTPLSKIEQLYARKIIAASTRDDNGYPLLEQATKCHQILKNICINGLSYTYPFDVDGIVNQIPIY